MLECLHRRKVALQHTDDEAARDIDEHDDDGRHGIALDELRSTIHRAEKVCFALDLDTPFLRLGIRDRALVQVGVDGHLLAWHCIEGEAGGDFCDTLGTLRDDDEVNADEDHEHDEADDRIAADNEVAECRDDLACETIKQDQSRRRNVQREAEQRRNKEERWKDRQIKRFLVVDDRHDDEERNRDVEADQEIEEQRRQRDDHHDDDDDNRHGDEHVAVLLDEAALAENAGGCSNG